jgi:hypothetical protein
LPSGNVENTSGIHRVAIAGLPTSSEPRALRCAAVVEVQPRNGHDIGGGGADQRK